MEDKKLPNTMPRPEGPCPCGSAIPFGHCCEGYHQGKPAPTPEALMRSRYSAFALGNTDYLRDSWHSSTRPASITPDHHALWKRLVIISTHTQGDTGQVHFRAVFLERQCWQVLEENSRFLREDGHWRYVDGQPTLHRLNPGRNDPCPCGSGQKLKKCCLGT